MAAMPINHGPNANKTMPEDISRSPRMRVRRYPMRLTSHAETSMPNMELKNSAKISEPDPASLSDQRTERLGNMGPRNVITIPVSAKSMCSKTVPLVTIGNFFAESTVEFMGYHECKSALSG